MMVHCQSDMKMSSLLDRPKLTDISPWPFSALSSSSRSTKLRGTMTTSPELLPIMLCHQSRGSAGGGCLADLLASATGEAQGGRCVVPTQSVPSAGVGGGGVCPARPRQLQQHL